MPAIPPMLDATNKLFADTFRVYVTLLKVMVPALIIVKLLDMVGATERLGATLSPVMSLLGLPDWMGVVWAATLLTNIFTGVVLFFGFIDQTTLSVEQVTVLGTLMLMAHSIPVEGAVAKRAGVPWRVTITLRMGMALFIAGALHIFYSSFSLLQEPAQFLWKPTATDDSLQAWVIAQIEALAIVFAVILGMMVLLKALRQFGLERLIHLALVPLLRILGIGRAAANVTVIGVIMGLSYGAGLLIKDVDDGKMSKRDSFLSLCFIGLVHSMIEDTLLIMSLGAHLSGILWARLALSILVIALLARMPLKMVPNSLPCNAE